MMLIFYTDKEGGVWKPFNTTLSKFGIRRILKKLDLDNFPTVSILERFPFSALHSIMLPNSRVWDTVNGWRPRVDVRHIKGWTYKRLLQLYPKGA